MSAFFRKIWNRITGGDGENGAGRSAKAAKTAGIAKNAGVAKGGGITKAAKAAKTAGALVSAMNASAAGGKGKTGGRQKRYAPADRRNYAGRLPICAGCLYAGDCGRFFPGCGFYGGGHDRKEIAVPAIQRGKNCASEEFAAWCAAMGYPVLERYWLEYEDVWDYYEYIMQEAAPEDGRLYELDDACALGGSPQPYDDISAYAGDVTAGYDISEYDSEYDGEYAGGGTGEYDDIDDIDDIDNMAACSDMENDDANGMYSMYDDNDGYDDE